jgi:alkaline phosphatase D
MRYFIFLGLLISSCAFLFGQQTNAKKSEPIVKKIAFGSCADQNKPQPILQRVDSMKPNLFIYVGDNIYADAKHFTLWNIRRQYKKLAKKPEFQQLKSHVPLVATWDDHDYGVNDGGKEFKGKEKSKKLFLKFWGEPKNSERWNRLGIYTSYYYKIVGNKTVQVILLDTRTFRSPLVKSDLTNGYDKNDYAPTNSVRATILGGTQWKWLEKELFKKADIRIIVSSTQFATEYNGYESWANFPLEQVRMYDAIEKTKANGVVFMSGDVHYAELNAVLPEGMYPLYDLTASGITEKWDHVEPSRYRKGKAFQENHFGMIEFEEDKKNKDVIIRLGIYDVEGEKRIDKTLYLSKLQLITKK